MWANRFVRRACAAENPRFSSHTAEDEQNVRGTRNGRACRSRQRDGVAAVEFAVTLPIVTLLVLGAIEIADMVFLRESLATASYEGARVGAKYDSQSSDVIAATMNLLTVRDVKNPTVTVNPADVSTAEKGELVTITVSAPCDDNSVLPLEYLTGQTMTFQATMVRE